MNIEFISQYRKTTVKDEIIDTVYELSIDGYVTVTTFKECLKSDRRLNKTVFKKIPLTKLPFEVRKNLLMAIDK
jgi:hypothetical protein